MKLTRKKTRGKRKARARASAHAASSSASSSVLSSVLSSVTSSASSSAASSDSPTSLADTSDKVIEPVPRTAAAKKREKVPFDHRFPLEILEQIFAYSCNPRLLECSSRLRYLLGSRRTLIQLCISTFGPRWDIRFPGKLAVLEMLAPAHELRDVKYHDMVLSASWAKVDILLDAQQIWLRQPRHRSTTYRHIFFEMEVEYLASRLNALNISTDQILNLIRAHTCSILPNADDTDTPNGSETSQAPTDIADHGLAPADRESGGGQVDIRHCFALDQVKFLALCDSSWDVYEGRRFLHNIGNYENEGFVHHTVRIFGRAGDAGLFDLDEFRDPAMIFRLNASLQQLFPLFPLGHGEQRISRGYILPSSHIPAWLLLGGGPYATDGPDPFSEAQRQAALCRLRSAFDMLFWMVLGGAQLQPDDSWEVTREGFRHLVKLVAKCYRKDPPEAAASEDERAKEDAGGHSDAAVPYLGSHAISYNATALFSGYTSLFATLGVFTSQWTESVFIDALAEAKTIFENVDKDFVFQQPYKRLGDLVYLRWVYVNMSEKMFRTLSQPHCRTPYDAIYPDY